MKRSEVDKKYLWSLEDIYSDDRLWEKDCKELEKQARNAEVSFLKK